MVLHGLSCSFRPTRLKLALLLWFLATSLGNATEPPARAAVQTTSERLDETLHLLSSASSGTRASMHTTSSKSCTTFTNQKHKTLIHRRFIEPTNGAMSLGAPASLFIICSEWDGPQGSARRLWSCHVIEQCPRGCQR